MRLLMYCALFVSMISFSKPSKAEPNMDLIFHLGPSLFQTGNIQNLGSPTFNTSIQFDYYLNNNHGLGVAWGNEFDFEGEGRLSAFMDDNSIHTFDIHYAYKRTFPNTKLRFSFTPGFGWQTLYDASTDYYWGVTYQRSLSSSFVLNYKLMLDYIVKTWNEDQNLFLGAGLSQIWTLNGDYKGQDLTGSRTSLLFRIGVGF